MPHISKSNEPKQVDVYVIISQEHNDFYVGKCKSGNGYQSYKNHVRGKIRQTRPLFIIAEHEQTYPKMYLLETREMTNETAYSYQIAWTKYFIDNGYKSLSTDDFIALSNIMSATTKTIYDYIRDEPVENVLNEEHILVRSYQKKRPEVHRKPKDEIKITVSEKEYITIMKRAQETGLTMSSYCRNMVLAGQIVVVKDVEVADYIAELRTAKSLLSNLIYSYTQNGRYFPADIEKIQRASETISEGQSKVSQALRDNTKILKKLLPK